MLTRRTFVTTAPLLPLGAASAQLDALFAEWLALHRPFEASIADALVGQHACLRRGRPTIEIEQAMAAIPAADFRGVAHKLAACSGVWVQAGTITLESAVADAVRLTA